MLNFLTHDRHHRPQILAMDEIAQQPVLQRFVDLREGNVGYGRDDIGGLVIVVGDDIGGHADPFGVALYVADEDIALIRALSIERDQRLFQPGSHIADVGKACADPLSNNVRRFVPNQPRIGCVNEGYVAVHVGCDYSLIETVRRQPDQIILFLCHFHGLMVTRLCKKFIYDPGFSVPCVGNPVRFFAAPIFNAAIMIAVGSGLAILPRPAKRTSRCSSHALKAAISSPSLNERGRAVCNLVFGKAERKADMAVTLSPAASPVTIGRKVRHNLYGNRQRRNGRRLTHLWPAGLSQPVKPALRKISRPRRNTTSFSSVSGWKKASIACPCSVRA